MLGFIVFRGIDYFILEVGVGYLKWVVVFRVEVYNFVKSFIFLGICSGERGRL